MRHDFDGSTHVKEGQLAIVIASSFTENIGIICRVLKYVGAPPFEELRKLDMHWWDVESVSRKFTIHDGELSQNAYAPDIALRPLSDIPEDALDTYDTAPASKEKQDANL